jgi:hypothetical protein
MKQFLHAHTHLMITIFVGNQLVDLMWIIQKKKIVSEIIWYLNH